MARFLLICLGGAVGTGARYLLGVAAAKKLGTAFPYGTLAVNLIGSFLIALVVHVGLARGTAPSDVQLVLTAGVLGGFTTYSSFNFETMRLLQGGAVGLGALNLALTVLGCLAAGWLGMLAGRLAGGAA